MRIGRFLIGSALLFTGWMVILSAAITVVGLPVGLAVMAGGLELMLGTQPSRAGDQSADRGGHTSRLTKLSSRSSAPAEAARSPEATRAR